MGADISGACICSYISLEIAVTSAPVSILKFVSCPFKSQCDERC